MTEPEAANPASPPGVEPPKPRSLPLYARVLAGVCAGALLGVLFGQGPIVLGIKAEHLGQLGVLVIKLLKALAIPLVFFSILDAFVKTELSLNKAGKLIVICLINVSVAMGIGLAIMNGLKPGLSWRGHVSDLLASVPAGSDAAEKLLGESHKGSLSLLKNIESFVPKTFVEPFSENNVLGVVIIALFAGAALRKIKNVGDERAIPMRSVEGVIEGVYHILVQMLHWVVEVVPFAVLGVVAQVVGKSGLGVFRVLWVFLATMMLGLVLHALVYYPFIAWLVGKKSPRRYLGDGADAIITGLSCNSSLATVPVTLRCLDKMGVSRASARMAACVGTNLNNDGITLYEAMAALFVAQAVGAELGMQKQLTIVVQSILAGAGVAGIPEAGLIILPLVLGSAGISEAVIAGALPLIMTVDWIIARARSGVNVMSDMLVAVLLDVSSFGRHDRPDSRSALQPDGGDAGRD